MSAAELIERFWADGFTVRLMEGERLSISPASKLQPEQRELVRGHKDELVGFLQEARQTTAELLAAAMRACDLWGDSDEFREQMRQDCLDTPPHLRGDLLDYFIKAYPSTWQRPFTQPVNLKDRTQ